MSTKAKRHIHKYHKVAMSHTLVWACALPDCNHYMPAHMANMVPGKASICWQCSQQMILDDRNMRDDKPVCFDCSHPNHEIKQLIESMVK